MINHSEEDEYRKWQDQQLKDWEALCNGCGACCGVIEGDPCEHLVGPQEGGKYSCNIYESRFGIHKTRSGQHLRCVPIRDILHKSWPGHQQCCYKKEQSLCQK